MNKTKVLNVIANIYNLSSECLFVKHEYTAYYKETWHAMIVVHPESDTCYMAKWKKGDKQIDTRKYNDIDSRQALEDLYDFIIE